ncbi:hypothetical protein ACFYW1_03450 [Streptomyces sp. NPDC002669]|uniref:hypothetical protein n=1 Tax=unclassified Streptomyces TaxID=2593676 RepID=UPI0036AD6687
MKRQTIIRPLLIAMTIPALTLAISSPASADGYITWQNKRTNKYLTATDDGVRGDSNRTDNATWVDIANSDGSYNEWSPGRGCLTGYYRSVYTEPCSSGQSDATNWWQRWWEISTSSGWKLQNRQTGYVLDDDGYGNIYANSTDWNNSNQRWR